MITSIAFTVYPVKNMAAARAFYEEALGLKVESNWQDQWIEYDIAGSTFAITSMDDRHIAGAKGALVGFEVSDVDTFAAGLKTKGVRFVQDVTSTPVCRMGIVNDPDGNEVVIHQRNRA